MTKTRVGGVKTGYVNRKKWLAQIDIAEHSIKTTDAVTTKQTWATRTWESIANGTLEEWQKDYLHRINFPETKEESGRRRESFKEARTARNIAVVTAEKEEKGTNLRPSQVKMACGGYKRATCKHVGGCNKQRAKGGLCNKHYNAMVAANSVLSQPANKDDELALPEPIAVADWTVADDWTAADREFFMDVMDWDVVTSDFPTPSEWSEEITSWAESSA